MEGVSNPYSQRQWWNILQITQTLATKIDCYEEALGYIPGSYKLWSHYLEDIRSHVGNVQQEKNFMIVNELYERALKYMYMMPRIWIEYCKFLAEQGRVTQTRRTYDSSLQSLPISQHDLVWESYLAWAGSLRVSETKRRIYSRYLQVNPGFSTEYISFLGENGYYQEASDKLQENIELYNTDDLFMKLADLLSKHPNEIENSESLLLDCLSKLPSNAKAWQTLAEMYIRRGDFALTRSTFAQAIESVVSITDFGLIFNSYTQFEEEILNTLTSEEEIEQSIDNINNLLESRGILLSDVKLKQNSNDVDAWLERAELFSSDPSQCLRTYAQAVTIVDPIRSTGPYHELWVSFAKIYENNGEYMSARLVYFKGAQSKFKSSEQLSRVVLEWAEFEISKGQIESALEIVKTVCCAQRKKNEARVGQEVWNLYLDLAAMSGSLETLTGAYDLLFEKGLGTVQNYLIYSLLLISKNQYDRAFRTIEQAISRFQWPHVYDIWVLYLHHFENRYKGTKLERLRDLYEQVISASPIDTLRIFYVKYAKIEEKYGLLNHVVQIYQRALHSVRASEKAQVFYMLLTKALEYFGISQMRVLFEESFKTFTEEDQVTTFGVVFADIERKLGEIDRSRAIHQYTSQYIDPRRPETETFWETWREFEIYHGNEDTFREMMRIKRTVSLKYSAVGAFIPEDPN